MGKFDIQLENEFGGKSDIKKAHTFISDFSYLEIETDFKGSPSGAESVFYFDDKFSLIGGAIIKPYGVERQLFIVDSFKPLTKEYLRSSEAELSFF